MHIGPRANARCASILTLSGTSLRWSDKLEIGILVRSSRFKISLDKPRRLFYRAANSVFRKVGRVASEEVTIQLFNSKCLHVLLYGLEACSLTTLSKSDLSSIDSLLEPGLGVHYKSQNQTSSKHIEKSVVYVYLIFLCGTIMFGE